VSPRLNKQNQVSLGRQEKPYKGYDLKEKLDKLEKEFYRRERREGQRSEVGCRMSEGAKGFPKDALFALTRG
jgi:hypothetical protein